MADEANGAPSERLLGKGDMERVLWGVAGGFALLASLLSLAQIRLHIKWSVMARGIR